MGDVVEQLNAVAALEAAIITLTTSTSPAHTPHTPPHAPHTPHANMHTLRADLRTSVLRSLFQFLNATTQAQLVLRVMRLVMQLRVSGNNLLNVCNVALRISKCDQNDLLFVQEDVLRMLGLDS